MNKHEISRYGLIPYHKTRDFRKKIAMLYYNVLPVYTEKQEGRFPVFKLGKNMYIKPDTASASSAHRPMQPFKKPNQPVFAAPQNAAKPTVQR